MSNGQSRSVARIPLSRIQVPPDLPRSDVSPDSIRRLADSIRLHGLLTPLLVRVTDDEQYLLVAGSRRLQALRQLNCDRADAVLLRGSACDCAMIALVENLQREQLHYLDVALACRRLLDHYPITQARLATGLSVSPSALANRLRLLQLPGEVQAIVRHLKLSERHARALLRLKSEADQRAMAELAGQKGLSVTQLERQIEACLTGPVQHQQCRVTALRDNRMIVNAVLNTVRRLKHIGMAVQSHVEEGDDCVRVIVTIPSANP